MIDLQKLKLKFISNEAGRQTDVILPIEIFSELIEDLEDLAAIAERLDEGKWRRFYFEVVFRWNILPKYFVS